MNNVEETLKKVWLNEKEIKIYLASLSIGQTTASILWNKTGIVRSTAQYACNSLVDKRLMNITPQGNSFIYSPEPPEKVISLVNKEYDVVDKKMQYVHSIMGYLNSLTSQNAKLPKVKYYTWIDGIIDILEDVFTETKEFHGVFNYVEDMHPDLERYIKEVYVPKRAKMGIPSKFLHNNEWQTKDYVKYDKMLNRTTMVVPMDMFPFKTGVHIYSNNKVALFTLSRNDMSWIIVESEDIKTSMFSMFKLWWNFAKTLPENNQK